MLNLTENPSYINLAHVYEYVSCQTFLVEVREGKLGKTAQFWIGYVDKMALILRFQRSKNNYDLHLAFYLELLFHYCLL